MKTYLLLFVLLITSYSFCQQFTKWKNYTNVKNATDVIASSNGVWTATGGGTFHYSAGDNSFLTLHKAEGLRGISNTAVAMDRFGKVWIGSTDGIIDIYNTDDNSFKVILDIANSNQTNKSINDISISGDTAIISSDFGVSLIDINSFIFYDTFSKFGSFPTFTKVNSTFKSDLFYVCTDEGIAIQKPGATNLSAPESWNVYKTLNGLPSNVVLKAGEYLGELIAATDKGFTKFADSIWIDYIPELSLHRIDDFIITGDSILILSENKISIYRNIQLSDIYTSNYTLRKLSYSKGFGITTASANGVLYLNSSLTPTFLFPNAPAANQFPSINVDNNGVLWSASGKDNIGVGYYTFDGETWNNYNITNTPGLPSNDVYTVYNSPANVGYLGTWGRGFAEVIDGNVFAYNRQNSGMQGIPQNPDFLVITGFSNDSKNNLWILNFWASDKKTLTVKTPQDSFYHFINPAAQGSVLQLIYNLDIDQYDTKWYSCGQAPRAGLYYFNENKTFEDDNDDKYGLLTTGDGLNTTDIRAVVVDRRGDIWVGTSLGVNVITNTNSISSSNPNFAITSVFTLRQQSVNAIVVDPLNQKWIGTNEGLLLVNSDGSRLLAALTSENSALLSNRIRSLTIDENAGIVYAATDEGLTSFETPYIKPLESFAELFVYPNPFMINVNEKLLTIDGLIRDTDIKILTISGKLIAEFSSPGGRTAYWDGKDNEGNFVSTGIYIIAAFDREGNNIKTGKVAVIRE